MIAYNRQSLDNLDLQQQAREGFERNLIPREEYDRIRTTYPYRFYQPDLSIRIGLFALTAIAAACGLGIFLLGTIGGGERALSMVILFYAGIAIIVLELFIHQQKMNGSGVDDALLWIAVTLLITGIILLDDQPIPPAAKSGLVLVFALMGMLRYLDQGMTLVAYGAFLCLIFYSLLSWAPVFRLLLPFIVIAVSIGCYLLFTRLTRVNGLRHYRQCLQLLRLASLLSLYSAGNYFVVRELNEMISGNSRAVAFGWLWWLLTAGVPVLYVVNGLKKKDALFLWTGMALVAASLLTVRYYYNLLPAEVFMVIAGAVLLAGVYGLTRYLRTPRRGFTAAPENSHPLAGLPLEGVIIAESFRTVAASPDAGPRFGGGTTGGGGAGGQY